MNMIVYNFDGGGGGDGPAGWGWVRSDGLVGCGGLAPGTTSNIAEYTALTMAVHDAIVLYKDLGQEQFLFKGDSKLVVEQVLGNWRVQADRLRPYVNHVQMLLKGLPEWDLQWIPRRENSKADKQAWEGKRMWKPGTDINVLAHPLEGRWT